MAFDHKTYDRERYQRIKPERYRQVAARLKMLRNWLDLIKRSGCIRCGENHPAVMDFHHRDPTTKVLEISNMLRRGLSKKTIQKEIDKCDLLCANCHRKAHYSRD